MINKIKNFFIENKILFGLYTISVINNSKKVYLDKKRVKNRYIKYFKYFNDDVEITMSSYKDYDQELFDKIFDLFIKYNVKCPFTIDVNYLNELNINLDFKYLKESGINIKIRKDFQEITLDEYIDYDDKLEDIIKDIKKVNLTPYEKYLAVYDKVKTFKEYKECNENKMYARKLEYVLDNEYITCVGFSELLVELLRKVGISAITYIVNFYKNQEYDGHQRAIVYLKDDTYHIDGYYVSDPTWDNDMDGTSYCFNAMTFKETANMNCLEFQTAYDYIFNVNSMEEFINNIASIEKRRVYKKLCRVSVEEDMYFIFSFFEKLNKELYDELSNIIYDSTCVNETNVALYIENVGEHVVKKTNKEISADVLMSAIMSYKEKMGIINEDDSLINLAENQIDTYDTAFPKITVESNDRTYYINEYNKYEEYVKKLKKDKNI